MSEEQPRSCLVFVHKMKTVIYNGKLICGGSIVPQGYVGIENGVITEIGSGRPAPAEKPAIRPANSGAYWIDAEGGYVSPGFIDLHVHGIGICDLYKYTDEGIKNIAKILARQGVTAFLPTLVTAPLEEFIKTVSLISVVNENIGHNGISGAHILGINLEGPYINPGKSGAQPVKLIRKPDIEELNRIIETAKGHIKIMTIAPEVSGNLKLAEVLEDNGIIAAIGHTLASFEETMAAIDRGINYISHTFNAMTPFHHRAPGALGAVFMRKEIVTEIIADGVHLHPAVVKFLCQLKEREKIILVTDALIGIMRRGDKGEFAGKEVVSNGYGAYSDEGILMGSVTPMNRAIQNITQYTDLDLTEAIKLATINPATLMGLGDRKGSLEIGKDADIVIFGQDFHVKTTLVGGKAV